MLLSTRATLRPLLEHAERELRCGKPPMSVAISSVVSLDWGPQLAVISGCRTRLNTPVCTGDGPSVDVTAPRTC